MSDKALWAVRTKGVVSQVENRRLAAPLPGLYPASRAAVAHTYPANKRLHRVD